MRKNSVCRTPYLRNHNHMIVIFGTHVEIDDISSNFFHFLKSWFWGFLGGKRAKHDLKLPISVCFALYLRNFKLYHQVLIITSAGVCLYIFLKRKHCKYKIFFYWPTSTVFLIIICFLSSSKNAKEKFQSEVCPTFFTCAWYIF